MKARWPFLALASLFIAAGCGPDGFGEEAMGVTASPITTLDHQYSYFDNTGYSLELTFLKRKDCTKLKPDWPQPDCILVTYDERFVAPEFSEEMTLIARYYFVRACVEPVESDACGGPDHAFRTIIGAQGLGINDIRVPGSENQFLMGHDTTNDLNETQEFFVGRCVYDDKRNRTCDRTETVRYKIVRKGLEIIK